MTAPFGRGSVGAWLHEAVMVLVAQKLADRPQAFDVIAHGFDRSGHGNRQQQARRIP